MKSQHFGAPAPEPDDPDGWLDAPDAPDSPDAEAPDTDPGAEPLSFRRERFCRAYARHGNAARAAREAGYAARFAKQRGHLLLQEAGVRARAEELAAGLDAEGAKAAGDPRALIAKLEAVYRHALGNGAFHAAARAVEMQARLARRLFPPPAGGENPAAGDEPEDLDALIARAEADVRRVRAEAEARGEPIGGLEHDDPA